MSISCERIGYMKMNFSKLIQVSGYFLLNLQKTYLLSDIAFHPTIVSLLVVSEGQYKYQAMFLAQTILYFTFNTKEVHMHTKELCDRLAASSNLTHPTSQTEYMVH